MIELQPLLRIWAKTLSAPPGFKPLLHHVLDVAAVAEVWQCVHRAATDRIAARFGLETEAVISARVFLAALHDLGKCSVAFQAKVPELWPEDFGPFPTTGIDRPHWRLTAMLCRDRDVATTIRRIFPKLRDSDMAHIVGASAGHHGQPPDIEADSAIQPDEVALQEEIGKPALLLAREIVKLLAEVLKPSPLPQLTRSRQAKLFSWHLAGLVTLADWVGSDAGFFRAQPFETPLAEYYDTARRFAVEALEEKGLLPARPNARPGLEAVAPQIADAPHPMQQAVNVLALPDGPALFILEDVTGSGKTEAALALASRLIAAGRAEGIYFALPTEATANAMFERLKACHRAFFAPGERCSLVLAHGRAALSEPFAKVRQAALNPRGEEEVGAQCTAWIADHRRKAFFAHVGAGTIDQAFLSILPKRFLTLRQLGLAGKVLIVDEAHAFDAYMGVELSRLLEMQAILGGSAIVLSATLPAGQKRKMIDGFVKGLGEGETAFEESDRYPLLTVVSREGGATRPVRASSERRVAVERVETLEEAYAAACAAADQGAAVLFIRNAVAEAVASAEALRRIGPKVDLFHARFAVCDRQRIEEAVLARFGRDAAAEDRKGRILVATQVVEQSLDLDFDLVISDLAPVDLLIQRAGRLWRHMDVRPASRRAIPGPRMLVLSPDPTTIADEHWLNALLGDGAYVYGQSGLMWRTAKTLFGHGVIDVPHGLRALIEAVYARDEVPEVLARAESTREGTFYSAEALARWNTIDPSEGYLSVQRPAAEQEIGTRLGRKTVTLRLARWRDGVLEPWAGAGTQAWARSEVSVPESWMRGVREPAALAAALESARKDWFDWERAMIGVVMEDGRLRFDGEAALQYSVETGLERIQNPYNRS